VGQHVGWFDMHGILITINARLGFGSDENTYWDAGSAAYFQSFGKYFLGGNPLFGSLDQWPPQWPRLDRTLGWGEPKTSTPRVTLPGGEPINMNPERGMPVVRQPENPRMPGFDPNSNLRTPANPSFWQRWGLRMALAWRAFMSGAGGSGDFIIVPNPALFRCQFDPSSCLPKRKT
jgi:hypothetical protein